MLYAGIPLKVLQALMGHKSISSTEVYTKVFALDVAARHRVQFQMPDADEAYCRNSAQCRTDRPPRTREKCAQKSSNTCNGCSSKTLLCDDGEIELNTPRDRENTFEPQLIKKNQTRITQMDSQILSLYAKGMTTREIIATFKEMYDADVSPTLISKVTDAVKEQVTERQNRQLDALYPIVYMDCIVVKVRQNGRVISKAIYTTNAIESLNSMIRAAIKKRKVFPTDDSVRKVVYLAIKDASKKWSMPIQNWRLAMSRFIIEFSDRLSDHL